MEDMISRKAAISVIAKWMLEYGGEGEDRERNALKQAAEEIKDLPSAQPEQQNARIFQGIIVEYPSISTYPEYEGKPYFSIKYTENGQDFIGYGTYKPDVLSEYLKKYFMSSAQPEIIRCKDCKHHGTNGYRLNCAVFCCTMPDDGFCSCGERREDG